VRAEFRSMGSIGRRRFRRIERNLLLWSAVI